MGLKGKMNADVHVVVESGGITGFGDNDESGVFTVHIRTRIDFNGADLSEVVSRLATLEANEVEAHISAAIADGLAVLIGPEITEGGIHYV